MLSQALTLLLQFSMLSLAMAAPMVSTAGHGNSWAYGTSGGIIGLIVLILDIVVFSKSYCLPASILSALP